MEDNQKYALLADNILNRQQEVWQYQLNIDNFTNMLKDLPEGDPPEEVAKYMATPEGQIPITVADEIHMAVADYQLRNKLRLSIRAEKVQQNIANRAMQANIAQIPNQLFDTIMREAKTRRDSQSLPPST